MDLREADPFDKQPISDYFFFFFMMITTTTTAATTTTAMTIIIHTGKPDDSPLGVLGFVVVVDLAVVSVSVFFVVTSMPLTSTSKVPEMLA